VIFEFARVTRRIRSTFLAAAFFAYAGIALAQAPNDHVAPPPPVQPMPAMSDGEMNRVMEMGDDVHVAMFKLDELERGRSNDATSTAWNAQGWYGGDFDKLWWRSEGEREVGRTDGRAEAFWDHAFASYWDWQLGARHDFGSGSARDWAAFGVQGTAPYWFSIEATAYLGGSGRTAARFRAEYELLLTQRVVLQSEFEVNIYGKDDRMRAVASGVSDAELGLRLRYEIRREIAPYIGIVRAYRRGFDDPSSFVPIAGGSETRIVAGLRIWL